MCDSDTFEFTFQSNNKTATVEVGQETNVSLTDILQAVQNILNAGGYSYVDEVRGVSYGELEKQSEINIESLIDQVLDFLFSENVFS